MERNLSFFGKIGAIIIIFIIIGSCKVQYSFTGASIDPSLQTISVEYFANRAPQVNPQLSQYFTDALRDKFRSDTRLQLVNSYGDVNFDGEIRGYDTQPMAITGSETAAKNRLTISIRVRYSNTVDPSQDFDTTFSRFVEYDSNVNFPQREQEFVSDIVDQIVQDIFNRAFVNW